MAGGVAVVCRAGISRSASLACAALMAHPDLDLTLRAAFLAIQQARPIVRPNHGFFAQVSWAVSHFRLLYDY